MKAAEKRGALVLRIDGALRFVSAAVALRVAPPPRVTPVPGAPPELVGIAMHEGTVVPVVAVGPELGRMIVCQYGGEQLGIVGAEIVCTGLFDLAGEGADRILHEGQAVERLELDRLYASVQVGARRGRWGN